MTTLWPTSLGVMVAGILAVTCYSPTSNRAISFAPFLGHLVGEETVEEFGFLTAYDYTVDRIARDGTTNGEGTFDELYDELTRSVNGSTANGAFLIATHGSPTSIAVEWFHTASERDSRLQELYHNSPYPPAWFGIGQVWSEEESLNLFVITATLSGAVATAYTGGRSLVIVLGCDTAAYQGWGSEGARCWLAYSSDVIGSLAECYLTKLLRLLRGTTDVRQECGKGDEPFVLYRNVGDADALLDLHPEVACAQGRPTVYGDGHTTLSPAVFSYEPTSDWQWVSPTRVRRDVRFVFDSPATPLSNWYSTIYGATTFSALTVISTSSDGITLDATVEVNGVGDHEIGLSANLIRGQGTSIGAALRLDGNTSNGSTGDDYVHLLRKSDGPVSVVSGLWVQGGSVTWEVQCAANTDHYGLEARRLSDATWVDLGINEPFSVGHHSVLLPSGAYDRVRLYEIETSGRRLVYDIEPFAGSVPPTPPDTTSATNAELIAILEALKAARGTAPPVSESDRRLLIITPSGNSSGDPWSSYVEDYVADYWRGRGCTVYVEYVDGLPTGDLQRRLAIRELIRDYHESSGVDYVHLICDATDWEQFHGSEVATYWNGPGWEAHRQSLLLTTCCDGAPLLRAIPTWAVADNEAGPFQNMSGDYPYYLTDRPYADYDGDGDADVSIGRWPVDSNGQVLGLATVMWTYNERVASGSDDYTTYWFVGNRLNDGYSYSDGLYAEQAYEYASAPIAAGRVRTMRESSFTTHTACIIGAQNFWNEQQGGVVLPPELAVVLSHVSTKYNIGNIFDRGSPAQWLWGPSGLCTCGDNAPLFIAASCHGADFATANWQDYLGRPYGHPLCELFLIYRKAIAFVGPTVGSWQAGNREITRAFVEKLYELPGRPMAESFSLARESVWEHFAGDDEVTKTADSYVFLGDPLSPFNPGNYAVVDAGVQAGSRVGGLSIVPNPSRGDVGVRFSLRTAGDVVVAVFDVAGRRVATIARGQFGAGPHEIRWDGRGNKGSLISTGVYWVRLEGPSERAAKRLVILR